MVRLIAFYIWFKSVKKYSLKYFGIFLISNYSSALKLFFQAKITVSETSVNVQNIWMKP